MNDRNEGIGERYTRNENLNDSVWNELERVCVSIPEAVAVSKRRPSARAQQACDDYKAIALYAWHVPRREIVPARKETRQRYTDRGNC